MKCRESGMPDETCWATFFDAEKALDRLIGVAGISGDLIEFGCGYGTFTLAAARRSRGVVTALDIEPEMVARTLQKASVQRIDNIHCEVRDFIANGTGLPEASQAQNLSEFLCDEVMR